LYLFRKYEKMHPNSRRQFLKQSALVSLGFLALSRCKTAGTEEAVSPSLTMQSDPANYLDLPEGFDYKIISRAGQSMTDGFIVPGRPDGMGAFEGPSGQVLLVRNHENSPMPAENSPFGVDQGLLSKLQPEQLYDFGQAQQPGLGGTTTLVYNEETGEVESEFLSLAGTYRNCAGGVTPWNSWLTCEEDVTKKEDLVEQDHGYVFEVPATVEPALAEPKPIKAMGRFNHEAVVVDPNTGIVYQTEDRHDGLIYRYIPEEPGNLHAGGRLQALVVVDQPSLDTRNWEGRTMEVGASVAVTWIDVTDIDAPDDDLRFRGFADGAARFARGEGMWWGEDECYFACTNGGPKRFGQIFRLRPAVGPDENDQLELFAESPDKTVLHACDNLTVAPWGDVILCEDNGERNYIRIINQQGQIYDFGLNRSSTSEFAGLVFSPSGKTLFVNIQENGDTLAITGDWDRLQNLS